MSENRLQAFQSSSASNNVFLPFEKLRVKDSTLLTVREDFWIKKKETLKSGLNIR